MKKSLIALAVAGVVSAPAFAATSNVDIYGVMSFAIEDTNANERDLEVVDRVSRFGFKGSEDLGGGLSAIWQIETQLNATNGYSGRRGVLAGTGTSATVNPSYLNTNTGNAFALRNTFVGLKSASLGTVLVGRHDTPYKLGTGSLDVFADTMGDYNGLPDSVDLVDKTHDHRSPQALAYISPTWSGFHFAAAVISSNDVVNLSDVDFTGSGMVDSNFDAISATAIYSNGPLFASLSYQDVDLVDSTAWKLGVGYTFGNFKVGGIYEQVDNFVNLPFTVGPSGGLTSDRDRSSWLINGAYTMGNIVLKGVYGRINRDTAALGTTDRNESAWALGADYNLSKRTNVYAMYAKGDNDAVNTTHLGTAGGSGVGACAPTCDDDIGGWALGVRHSF